MNSSRLNNLLFLFSTTSLVAGCQESAPEDEPVTPGTSGVSEEHSQLLGEFDEACQLYLQRYEECTSYPMSFISYRCREDRGYAASYEACALALVEYYTCLAETECEAWGGGGCDHEHAEVGEECVLQA